MSTSDEQKTQASIYVNLLTKVKKDLDDNKPLLSSLKNYNEYLFKSSLDFLDDIKKEIDNTNIILKKKLFFNEDNKKEKIFIGLHKKYGLYHETISKIYDNNYLNDIKNSLYKIDEQLNIIFDYQLDPPNINSFEELSGIKLDFSKLSKMLVDFYGLPVSLTNDIEENDKKIPKCSDCGN